MIDFATLYEHPISKPCALWEKCHSHCCTIGRLLQPFDPATHLVDLPIPAAEYEYLRGLGAPGDQWPEPPRVVELRLSDYSLTLYMQPCLLGGACNPGWRPSICRIYPYLPLVDDGFRIAALKKATALDLAWEPADADDPCLLRAPDETRRHVEALTDLVDRLRRNRDNLELLLWFNLAFRYVEAFGEYLAGSLPAEGHGVSLEDSLRTLYFCNKTQLFLSDPAFRRGLDAEVERFRRWRRG